MYKIIWLETGDPRPCILTQMQDLEQAKQAVRIERADDPAAWVWLEDEKGNEIPVSYHPTDAEQAAIDVIVEMCKATPLSVDYQAKIGRKTEIAAVLEPFRPLSRQRILSLANDKHYHATKVHDYCD